MPDKQKITIKGVRGKTWEVPSRLSDFGHRDFTRIEHTPITAIPLMGTSPEIFGELDTPKKARNRQKAVQAWEFCKDTTNIKSVYQLQHRLGEVDEGGYKKFLMTMVGGKFADADEYFLGVIHILKGAGIKDEKLEQVCGRIEKAKADIGRPEMVFKQTRSGRTPARLASGLAYVLDTGDVIAPKYYIEESQVEEEVGRLQALITPPQAIQDSTQVDIMGVMVANSQLEKAIGVVRAQSVNAEYAVNLVVDAECARIRSAQSSSFLKRTLEDCRSIGTNIISRLMGAHPEKEIAPFLKANPGSILVADTLSVDAIDSFVGAGDLGGAVFGSLTPDTHACIACLNAGIPFVSAVGSSNVGKIRTGDKIVIDNVTGDMWVNPSLRTLHRAERRAQELARVERRRKKMIGVRAKTSDGAEVNMRANIDTPEEIRIATAVGSEGVGLYRIEHWFAAFQQRKLGMKDIERELTKTFSRIVADYKKTSQTPYKKDPLTIRLLDIGRDKIPQCIREKYPEVDEPGYEGGIKFLLKHRELMLPILKAILRAGSEHDVRILIPMVTDVGQVDDVNEYLREAKAELKKQNKPFNPHPKIGVMIETPSAVDNSAKLAREVEFFSIGTNDLTRLYLDIERDNPEFSPIHSVLLRQIKATITSAKEAGIEVSVCGQMAGDPYGAILLAGMGIDTLSMSGILQPEIKEVLSHIQFNDARKLVDELTQEDADHKPAAIKKIMDSRFPVIQKLRGLPI
ncbi:MAG: putative PEP-binding protein [Candidatus Altiarchaeota archaeon]